MSLTRKDYQAIASAIADASVGGNMVNKGKLIHYLAIHFKKDNPTFNAAKFEDACEYDTDNT